MDSGWLLAVCQPIRSLVIKTEWISTSHNLLPKNYTRVNFRVCSQNKAINTEDININVGNDILNVIDDMTVLGVDIDSKLNFNVSSICDLMVP